ncbi:MAG: penicillin-binding protein 2 [Candidatus Binatota bacterium]|nr:penicillin-binding protein 2 [Candidatus Binatota bacterium]
MGSREPGWPKVPLAATRPGQQTDERDTELVRTRDLPDTFRRRLNAATALALLAFFVLFGRLWHLQVTRGDEYRVLSEHNRIRLKRVKAIRGLVFDRKGTVLVENRPSFDVVMVPEDAREPDRVIDRLEGYLEEQIPEAHQALTTNVERPPFQPVVLKRDVDWRTLVAVETRQIELPGVSLRIGPRRSYLYGSLLAHLLGYIGEVNMTELTTLDGYRMSDMIGKYGLEKHWEDYLRGENGGEQIEVDAVGRELRVLREVEQVPGANIHLTLDMDLQQAAYDALEGHEGSIVALDPTTGAILALVSRPSFDPNLFSDGISVRDWTGLLTDPLRPLSDRAVQGQYPPGSTFKIAVAAAALEEGVVNPFTRIPCSGSLWFGNRAFRCWKKGGHGWMNLHEAIVQSCDVYFYQVGQRLGVDTIAQYARKLGLGSVTGVRLDHEKAGTIPDSAWKRRVFGEPWYPGETLSVAIGQGYVTATPLQMANAIATIAGGGIRHRPHFVDYVEMPSGEIARPNEDEPIATGLRASTVVQLKAALRDVVASNVGTGKKARVEGIEVGGKTGTSQVVRLRKDNKKVDQLKLPRQARDHAWFIAFAPVEAPEIAIACMIEHAGGGGGAVAAPIVQKVLSYYFRDRIPHPEPEPAVADAGIDGANRQTARATR